MHSVRANVSEPDHHSSPSGKSGWNRRQTVEMSRGAAYYYRTASKERHEQPESIKSLRSIALALIVIAAICGIIALAIVIVSPEPKEVCKKGHFTYEDIFNESLKSRLVHYTWRADTLFWVHDGQVVKLDPLNEAIDQRQFVLRAQELNLWKIEKFSVSADERLIAVQIRASRSAAESRINLYDTADKSTRWITLNSTDRTNGGDQLQLFEWCPVNACFIFIKDNNLYYTPAGSLTPLRLSSTGKAGLLYNGIADPLYERDVTKSTKMFWWSPSAAKLAFAETNLTRVPLFTYSTYSKLYPQSAYVRYPRAGDVRTGILPEVRIIVYDLQKMCVLGAINTSALFLDIDTYLIGFEWLKETLVVVEWTNRMQNTSYTFLCNVPENACNASITCSKLRFEIPYGTETWKDIGWADVHKRKYFRVPQVNELNSVSVSYVTTALQDIRTDLIRSVAVMNLDGNAANLRYLNNALDKDHHEVSDLVAFNYRDNIVFYTAPKLDDPKSKHVFSIKISANGPVTPSCLTCNMTPACNHVLDVSFSSTWTFFVAVCRAGDVIKTILRSTVNASLVFELESNDEVQREYKKLTLSTREYHVLKRTVSTDYSYKLEIELQVPENINYAFVARYPLLLFVNNEPDTQSVVYDYTHDWMTFLCSTENVIIAKVDGRGSSGRGRRFAYQVYKNLGVRDAEDQLAALTYLAELRYVDKTRMAIAGSSYGGYLALRMLAAQTAVLQLVSCAVIISPITDLQYYSAPFAERYLGSKSDSSAYDSSSVLQTPWQHLNHTRLLLTHGTADETVHFEHTLRLIKVLNDANVQFSAHIYPDVGHKLDTGSVQRHFTKHIMEFLSTCFLNKTVVNQETNNGQERRR